MADISFKPNNKISEIKSELNWCFTDNEKHYLAVSKAENRQQESLIKIASDLKDKRSFRRAS